METMYLVIVIFLLCLAVFDLFVGVSNDAVNFLQSAVGAKVAKFRTIIVIASAGVIFGAMMSSGMMDVARHAIMVPSRYSFNEVMTVFLAVMVTDVVILDMFNTLGMPTSTTVSLVFELLGATFALACVKMFGDPTLAFSDLLNTDKALSVILAIFVSVAIAFVFGLVVMWISRIVFTFNYEKHLRYSVAVFGGIAFTTFPQGNRQESLHPGRGVCLHQGAYVDTAPVDFPRLDGHHGGAPSASGQRIQLCRADGNIRLGHGLCR